jgi:L,D-transpeptidase catalytic domain
MKRFFFVLLTLSGIFITSSAYWYLSKFSNKKHDRPTEMQSLQPKMIEKLLLHVNDAKKFVSKYHFNEKICLLIDMSIESGKNRLFIYDLSGDSVVDAGLVTHGRCNEAWLVGRKYGNEIGCGCTSLGKYKIGHAYQGRFGLAYKLTGLDKSNNNAFRRYVVLHGHECVPEDEVYPAPICQSDGCPTVSKSFLKNLAGIIDKSPQPILLWIYD